MLAPFYAQQATTASGYLRATGYLVDTLNSITYEFFSSNRLKHRPRRGSLMKTEKTKQVSPNHLPAPSHFGNAQEREGQSKQPPYPNSLLDRLPRK
jgi:hypothetical protein